LVERATKCLAICAFCGRWKGGSATNSVEGDGKATNVNRRLEEPLASALRVGNRLLGRKRLAGDDEQGRFGIALARDLGNVGSIDVGDKVDVEVLGPVRFERLAHHHRSQVGSSDSDVDDRGDALARVALPLARTNLVGELGHVVQHALHLVNTLLLDLELAPNVPQRDVQHGTVLRGVDVLAGKHLIAGGLDAGFAGELDEGREDVVVDEVFGEVDEEVDVFRGVVVAAREFGEALRVRGEKILEDEVGVGFVVEGLKGAPSGVVCVVCKKDACQRRVDEGYRCGPSCFRAALSPQNPFPSPFHSSVVVVVVVAQPPRRCERHQQAKQRLQAHPELGAVG
jgi:hypothetical protein